jgi:hypothetical protein
MAELLDATDPTVGEFLDSTRVILERLRAKPYLERLDAAVARSAEAPTGHPGVPAAKPIEVARGG